MTKKAIATPPGEPTLHVDLTAEELAAHAAREQAFLAERDYYLQYEKYKDDRRAEYPTIEEQLDMLYNDQVSGTSTWVSAIATIKAKYPKPTE